jgi:hypothetical protein
MKKALIYSWIAVLAITSITAIGAAIYLLITTL